MITGRSGSGKTTLLRSLAELWPYATGTLRRPGGDNDTMFLSQLPYVPLGDLRSVVSYPLSTEDVSDAELHEVLTKVALAPLITRLDEDQDWAKVLSPGEQQRVAFARILLTRPKAVFLDESTSALDPGLEYALYQLVRTELPDTIVVSVSHRPTVEQHHERHLELLGEGSVAAGAGGKANRRRSSAPTRPRPGGPRALRRGGRRTTLPQLRPAGVAFAVLGDVGGASPGGVQSADHAAVGSLHFAVDVRPDRRW